MGILIKKDKTCLFLRVPNYKKYNSIEEHIKVIDNYNYVWLLKLGRTPNYNFLKQFMEDSGNLIVKSSPKYGNKYYYFKVVSKEIDSNIIYPKYYDELFYEENYDIDILKQNYLWLKIIGYKEIPVEKINKFVTISKNTSLSKAVNNCRVPQVYAKALEDILI